MEKIVGVAEPDNWCGGVEGRRRRTAAIRVLLAVCVACTWSRSPAAASEIETLHVDGACSYFGEDLPSDVATFGSDTEAEELIGRIVDAAGIAQNFRIRAAGVPNAAATIRNGQRYILYNQRFMQQTERLTGTEWAAASILAHEIGHHLNGHTLDGNGSQHESELQADYYSGFVLERLGATLDQATVAMEQIGSERASDSHPAKNDRIAAITSGWTKSCESDASCRTGSGSAARGRSGDREGRAPSRSSADDSCEFANDGECDEPRVCDAGTDSSDCGTRGARSASRRPRIDPDEESAEVPNAEIEDRRSATTASVCLTPAGQCPLPPGPRNIVCTCFVPVLGGVPGISW